METDDSIQIPGSSHLRSQLQACCSLSLAVCLMSFSQTLMEVSLQSERKKLQMGVCQGGELAGVEIRSFLGHLCLCPGDRPPAPSK